MLATLLEPLNISRKQVEKRSKAIPADYKLVQAKI